LLAYLLIRLLTYRHTQERHQSARRLPGVRLYYRAIFKIIFILAVLILLPLAAEPIGRATARPLFGSCGPPLSLARPLFWVM